jgi:hypothetical protein
LDSVRLVIACRWRCTDWSPRKSKTKVGPTIAIR